MVTCQVLAAVVLYCTHMMTVPMHTLPPSAERRHHRWPPWVRPGLVMKPLAVRSAWVTPWPPATWPAAACGARPRRHAPGRLGNAEFASRLGLLLVMREGVRRPGDHSH